jgi:hypothetical protein
MEYPPDRRVYQRINKSSSEDSPQRGELLPIPLGGGSYFLEVFLGRSRIFRGTPPKGGVPLRPSEVLLEEPPFDEGGRTSEEDISTNTDAITMTTMK